MDVRTRTEERDEEHDEDEDSLFGSPPPSPQLTGRPASPALALPSSGCSGSRPSTSTALATQNVGTIALPGSHPDSELPINPLALSLNHGIVQRPPAQQKAAATASNAPYSSVTRISTPSTRFQTDTGGPGPSAVRNPKKRSRQSSRADTQPPAQPRGLEFALPDPCAPPPAHFLRNQENLLGRAGLVAGVKPAALTHSRGSTPSNPILVDDEEDRPILGRSAGSREKSQPFIDPSLLTAPTNQEIVQVLIGQKDIFPILEGVLKLVIGNAAIPSRGPTGFERRPSNALSSEATSGPPVKKRKLNRVPAGAADWDVPYPFQLGEGPDSYHSTWERERGKQLISQLIKLIKSAARKAATKKYLQQEQAREQEREAAEKKHGREPKSDSSEKINRHYRPETAMYGTEQDVAKQAQTQIYDVLQDASNSRILRVEPGQSPSAIPATTRASTVQPQDSLEQTNVAFDQLMTSLNGALPNEQQTSVNPVYVSQPTENAQNSPADIDQPIFDTWMSFLENFPISFDGMPSSGEQTSQCSTPGLDDFNFVSMLGSSMAANASADETASNDYDAMLSSILNQPQMAPMMNIDATVGNPFGDHLIDPSLMGLAAGPELSSSSMTNANNNMNTNHHQNPGLSQSRAPSPVASTSSSGNNDPSTPASAGWDLSMPDVYLRGTEGGSDGQGWDGGLLLNDGLPDFGLLPEATEKEPSSYVAESNDKGKQRAVELSRTPTPTPMSSIPPPPLPTPQLPPAQSMLDALLNAKPGMSTFVSQPRARQLRKEEIVKRAQEKRQRIQQELDTVKTKLWETTIEQAGLVHLIRRLDEAETRKEFAS